MDENLERRMLIREKWDQSSSHNLNWLIISQKIISQKLEKKKEKIKINTKGNILNLIINYLIMLSGIDDQL